MVMELLEGEDLEHVLARRGPLPPAEAVDFLLQAGEAIAEAHALGIVHRDLKPANLFLARRPSGPPVVKVLDFGISKAPLSAKEKALTQDAALMGSPAYMSPEQMKASRDVDARSDIWSLGVVLHELLTGGLPFPGDSVATLITATLHDRHLPLSAYRPDLPHALQHVVDGCLEKDPARRFATVAALARALAPLGPPRSALSVERIVTVLEQQGPLPAAVASASPVAPDMQDPRISGPGGTVAIPGGSRAATTDPTVAVSGPVLGMPGSVTLSPTSGAAQRKGRSLVLPGAVLGALTAAVVAYAVLHGRGSSNEDRASARNEPPPASATATAAATPSLTMTPMATEAPTTKEAAAPTATGPAATAVSVPSVTASARTWAAAGRPKPSAAAATAAPVPTAATPAAAPTCKVVSYFDADGTKHFRQECR
jgi:serine/threonine-protein kinase